MKIVYLSNYFNHHQKFLSDELLKLTDGNYLFVETESLPQEKINLGYRKYAETYIRNYKYDNITEIQEAIMEADAVIYGEAPLSLIMPRYKAGLLVFRDDESRYKSLVKYLKWPIYTWKSRYINMGYLLCASAFGCRDYHISGMPLDKCFRWGYFPDAKIYNNVDELLDKKGKGLKHREDVSILWVGRLIGLKHPELPIMVAKKLKDAELSFHMEIIGIGPLEEKLKRMISEYKLNEYVDMLGSMPHTDVRKHMENAHIFLFTSDRGEGWGAVLNESMNSACAVVASPVIGASPYLIKESINGLFFRDRDAESLYEKVLWLIKHPKERIQMGKQAYFTITEEWSAKKAANNLIQLIKDINLGKISSIENGPCSCAPYLKRNWYSKYD